MKIEINGQFTKEELLEKIKEFDVPKWEVKKDNDGNILLFKNGMYSITLLCGDKEDNSFNLSTISRDMAGAMCDLMETKDVLNDGIRGYYIHYNAHMCEWDDRESFAFTNSKHFKTLETAKLAAKLLNESVDMKNWIKRMSE